MAGQTVIATAGGPGVVVIGTGDLAGALQLAPSAGTAAVWVDTEALPVGVGASPLTFTEFLHRQDAGAGVRYLFSTNQRRSWVRWNGATWVSTADLLLGSWDEANAASALNPAAMLALDCPAGVLHLRIWMKTSTPGNTVILRGVQLGVEKFLPLLGLHWPEETPLDLAQVTVITTGETGSEERWQKRTTHRRQWRLRWSGLTLAERDGLLAFAAAKQNYATFHWTPPGEDTPLLVRLADWGVSPQDRSAPFFDATATVVVV